MLMHRVVVGRALIFDRCPEKVLAFKQDFGQQEVGVDAIRLPGEVGQVLAVPVGCFLVVAALAVFLCLGMIVLREVVQVCFQVGRNGRVLFRRITLPERAVHAVAIDVTLLAFENERREAAPLVSLDDLDLHERRLRMIRLPLDECLVCLGGIDKALLLEIQVAEIHIDDVPVFGIAALAQVIANAFRRVHVRKADAQDAKRVFDQFPFCTA